MKNILFRIFFSGASFIIACMCCTCGYDYAPLPSEPEAEENQSGTPETPDPEDESQSPSPEITTIDYTDFAIWGGDTALFEQRFYPGGYSLFSLNDQKAGKAYLSSSSTALRGAQWDFRFQLNGKEPTATTQARFYLAANNSDLRDSLQGYFLALGISNSGLIGDPTGQYLALCRQDGSPNDTAIIFDCHYEMLLTGHSMPKLRVRCDEQGKWELFVNIEGLSDLSQWGNGTDTTYTKSTHLGFYCTYTLSRSQNYAFGDLKVQYPAATE